MPLKTAITDISFYMRTVRMRMPFRFGAVTLRSAANLHVLLDVELEDGRRARGAAADMLAPKWFDKDPDKDHADNIEDLIKSAHVAATTYREVAETPQTPFAVWREGYESARAFGDAHGLNHLAAGHGATLMERALIDALGRATGQGYHALMQQNLLGLDLGAIHAELASFVPADALAPAPLQRLHLRHTVGLVDPIRTSDIAAGDRLDDGLPQSLEEYVRDQGVSYFKIKVGGDVAADLGRLESIAGLLDETDRPYKVTLDGNEQYDEMPALLALLDRLEKDAVFGRFYRSMLYIEQPLDRRISLDPELAPQIRAVSARKPMLIDESDEDLDTFKRAVELGYLGVSAKACKGVVKALINQALVRRLNADGGAYFVSGEDLTNVPAVSLHQDLAHLAALGIPHAERNGHHYVRGLDHLSPRERRDCARDHDSLYRQTDAGVFLDVREGCIDLASLGGPGLGGGALPDESAMVPLDEWDPQSLEGV